MEVLLNYGTIKSDQMPDPLGRNLRQLPLPRPSWGWWGITMIGALCDTQNVSNSVIIAFHCATGFWQELPVLLPSLRSAPFSR